MNKKRAQVTIFIILAIIIVAAIVSYFILREKTSNTDYIDPEIKPIYNFVQECLKNTGENALIRIGEQGGYFRIPQEIPSINDTYVYLIYNQSNLLSNENIEQQLNYFINEEIGFCILNFKDFPNFNITSDSFVAESRINKDFVTFNLKRPIIINKGNSVYNLKDFNVDVPVRFGMIYSSVKELIDEQINHTNSICATCLYKIGEKNGLSIESFDADNSTAVYTFIDEKSKLNNQPYEFVFAAHYTW